MEIIQRNPAGTFVQVRTEDGDFIRTGYTVNEVFFFGWMWTPKNKSSIFRVGKKGLEDRYQQLIREEQSNEHQT